MSTVGEPWMWALFFLVIILALFADIIIFSGKKAHLISIKEALTWTSVWVMLALLFNVLIWWHLKNIHNMHIANVKSLEFFTGYLLEKSLSIDNVFVFLMIFNYFNIPGQYQRRVLLYGVLGAIVMRLFIILFGIYLVSRFHWILYIFGAFLLFTGMKMLILSQKETSIEKNFILIWMRKNLRITKKLHGESFFIRDKGLIYFTPLFLVLVLIEISDLIFAVDSIPAVFSITHDPFIVFTSNIFAVLGLRALYFVFAHMANRFQLLKYGISIILVFIGCKMLIAYWYDIPIITSLGVIIIVLLVSIFLSIRQTSK